MHPALKIILLLLLVLIVSGLVLAVMFQRPYDSGKRWKHSSPPAQGLRINTLLNMKGAREWREGQVLIFHKEGARFFVDGPIPYTDSDWTIQGVGIVVTQKVEDGATLLEFKVLWKYPWFLRGLLTWVNSAAQKKAQGWVRAAHPEMME
jgi:hypothetical protein